MKRTPTICAHAGCEGLPMDGLEALDAGIRAGADVVELDLRFTAEGVAVLSHDPVGSRRRSPLVTLDQALRLLAEHPQVGLNIDVKELRPLAAFPNPLTLGTIANPVYCTGLRWYQFKGFRAICPGIAYAVTYLPWWFFLVPQGTKVAYLKRQKQAGASALNVSFRLAGQALVEACRRADLPLGVWTVDESADFERLADLGVDGITTNRVTLARSLLG